MRARTATFAGLALALVGPYALLLASRRIGAAPYALWPKAVLWGLCVAVVVIVVGWERRPLSSIGLGRFSTRSAGLGVLAGCVIVMVFPLAQAVLEAFGLQGYRGDIERAQALPLPLGILDVATAGVVEEVLYRGYAIERTTELTGRRWVGALVPLLLFTLAHAFAWAPSHLATVALVGGLLTLLYLWQRDLWTCIVAHTTMNAIGFLVVPLLSRV